MKIFISGASGLVGNNCYKHFKALGHDVVGTHLSYSTDYTSYFDTLNLKSKDNFDVVSYNPDVIVHCGALTHVDYCETNVEESYEKTVQSTLNLLSIAAQVKANFVFISTDYVFDGINGPYIEDAATNPLSVYGKHKLEAEQAVLNSGLEHLILRVTNVYGDELRNKNFVARIVEQCKQGKELNLVLPVDQYASPTNAMDIAKAMELLISHNHQGIYHIGSTDYMNRVALALNVLKYFPASTYALETRTTAELNQTAARPLMGGFITRKFNEAFPGFRFTTIDDYLMSRIKS